MLLIKSDIAQTRIHDLQTTSKNIDCTGAIIHGEIAIIVILTIHRKLGYTGKKRHM